MNKVTINAADVVDQATDHLTGQAGITVERKEMDDEVDGTMSWIFDIHADMW